MISAHCVRRGFVANKKPRLYARDEWYYRNQNIHPDLNIIYLTLSLAITCINVERHLGELGQLTHHPSAQLTANEHHHSESA